ncbi:MAG TPA: bacillithiol biosynthesis cysteine-adding enzyme BshC, partial [Bacteroidia bacterium]|nr:bacillithiol biosynthesis cysteine-adding enzyme BshC [Bacteroidia bacterium]
MKKSLVPFNETHQFSAMVDDYLSGDEKLRPYYKHLPDPESMRQAIDDKRLVPINRRVLHECLIQQYGDLLNNSQKSSETVKNGINKLLDENTFTVTTGHQLNLFTGPLYSIYKIATTISLAGEIQRMHPQYQIVPVFWMASEDHDFAEINHARIYTKTISWNREAKGPAGRLKMDDFNPVLEEFKSIVGDQQEIINLFENAYASSANLAEATRKIIHALFGSYGLVVIDGDDEKLKKLFIGEMKTDLLDHLAFEKVTSQSAKLGKNYKVQVQPREINLFYIEDNLRERIVKEDAVYKVLNTEIKFSESDILKELDQHPEKFSPNVVLRPLYQGKILPNLASIGGPEALNYWLVY